MKVMGFWASLMRIAALDEPNLWAVMINAIIEMRDITESS